MIHPMIRSQRDSILSSVHRFNKAGARCSTSLAPLSVEIELFSQLSI